MEANLIKEQMTQKMWYASGIANNTSGHGMSNENITIKAIDYPITIVEVMDIWKPDVQTANAAAIVSAVNGTFGKNINPEKVEEMHCMLEILESVLTPLQDNPVHHEYMSQLKQLIHDAKL